MSAISNHVESDCACKNPPEARSATKRVVTLVHGTFAKHADWIQDDRKLTGALQLTGEDTVLDRFCWSGRNRHRHRLDAGDALRAHLVKLVRAHTDAGAQATYHIIAHSHGGNVALYALRERGDEDDALLAQVNVIALATPFIFMRERVSSRWLFGVLPLSLLVSALFAAIVYSEGLGGLGWFGLLLLWSVVGLVSFPLSLSLFRAADGTPARKDLRSGDAVFEAAKRISVPDLAAHRIMVIRGLGDEASGPLIAAQTLDLAMTKLTAIFTNWPTFLFWTFMAGVVGFAVIELVGLAEGDAENVFGEIFGTLILAFIMVPVVTLPLIAGFVALANVSFGWDAMFWNYYAQTTAEHSPRGMSSVLVVGMRQYRFDKLSHSVYDDAEAIEAMVTRVNPPNPAQAPSS